MLHFLEIFLLKSWLFDKCNKDILKVDYFKFDKI